MMITSTNNLAGFKFKFPVLARGAHWHCQGIMMMRATASDDDASGKGGPGLDALGLRISPSS
jgi:hypothetical protein